MKGENILTAEEWKILYGPHVEILNSSVTESQKGCYSIAEAAPLISPDLDEIHLFYFMVCMKILNEKGFPNKLYFKDGLLQDKPNVHETLITEAGIEHIRDLYRDNLNV